MRRQTTSLGRLLCIVFVVSGLYAASLQAPAMAEPPTPIPPHPRPLHEGLEGLPHLASTAPRAAPRENLALSQFVAWSRLAFQSYRHSNWDIYVAQGDGSHQTRVTRHHAADIQPRLNRGCTRIVFASNRTGDDYKIFTINPDGSDLRQLTANGSDDVNPSWSPDGTRIAFESYRDGQAEIYVMNADGSNQTRLTWSDAYDGQPTWSPDGTRIAFTSSRSGGYGIWVMPAPVMLAQVNADGSEPRLLADQPYSENPTWSPDGSQIAYDADGDGDGWQELWLMNADGSNQRQVYDMPGFQIDIWARSWSPEGRYVAFTRISWTYRDGNWYWTRAELAAWDSVYPWMQPRNLSMQGTDWAPDWQTTDAWAPTSSVNPLPGQSPGPFTVSWSGSDNGAAGLKSYDVQVRDGADGTWRDWQTDTTATSASYPGVGGHTYYFRSRARDNAYNLEPWPPDYDAMTTVEALPPHTRVERLPSYSRSRITVRWGGYDPGGSGIETYDAQYRDTSAGDWTDWQMGTSETSASFSGAAGHTYYFRSRARDRAQNVESWPSGDGDTSTTLYAWAVTGTARDNAGTPVHGAIVTTRPDAFHSVPSDGSGAYAAYVAASSETYTATWGKAGYGELPATAFSPSRDAFVDVFLPPADNVVTNWGFERGDPAPEGWMAGGVVTPVATLSVGQTGSTARHTGDHSVMLGQPGRFAPVVNISNTPDTARDTVCGPTIAMDSEGTLHVLWNDDLAGNLEILYASKPVGGAWSVPINISNSPYDSTSPTVVVDSANGLHAVWRGLGSIVYATKAKDGDWSAPVEIPNAKGYGPSIAVDGEGTLHVLWDGRVEQQKNAILYASRPAGGDWSSPVAVTITGYDAVAEPVLVVGPRNVLHALWIRHTGAPQWQVFYASKPPTGAWSAPINISNNSSGAWSPDLTVDAEGTLHAVWRSFDPSSMGVVYASKPQAGPWKIWGNIASGEADGPAIATLGTDVYVAWHQMDEQHDYDVLYTRKAAGAGWDMPMNLSNNPGWSVAPAITLKTGTVPHVLWCDSTPGNNEVYYRGPASVEQTGDSFVAQIVSVPITMTTPMLSFLYQLDGAFQASRSWFNVQVDNGLRATTLFSTTTRTDGWTHRWFDLSAWAGQTITLTLNVHQTAGYPYAWAYLDEVTLGSAYPDLWVRTSGRDARPGEQVVYTIAYGNRGGATATSVRITATLPTEFSFVDAKPPPVTTTLPVVWDVGDLPAKSGPFTIVVTATVASAVPLGSTLTNTVAIEATSAELETFNNTAQAASFIGYHLYMPVVTRGYLP